MEFAQLSSDGSRFLWDCNYVIEIVIVTLKRLSSCRLPRGKQQISNFLWNDQEMFEREMESLKLVEETLDTLIKRCAQQLFDMTDDTESAAYPFTSNPVLDEQ